jgi:probable F420-dependent oxidoreductase
MQFHQSVAFLETDQYLQMATASEELGFAGMYVSDHLVYPKELRSRYTYSPYDDGSPVWAPESDWPDSWCAISAMAAVTRTLEFTTGVYIAPARDLITVAKLVGTAAVLSDNRVNLGVAAGWCKEEFDLTGQEFSDRGARLDDMIPALRALWQRGWVEYHGTHYDVPLMQVNPAPTAPVPVIIGGDSPPALRRMAALGDGWAAARVLPPDETLDQIDSVKAALAGVGRTLDGFRIFATTAAQPEPALIRRFEDAGVTDWICAPWMVANQDADRGYNSTIEAKIELMEQFADQVIGKAA